MTDIKGISDAQIIAKETNIKFYITLKIRDLSLPTPLLMKINLPELHLLKGRKPALTLPLN